MIVHTLIYRFPQPVPAETRRKLFAEARETALGTGLVTDFDHRPQLTSTGGSGSEAVIAQLVFENIDRLRAYATSAAVHDFIKRWKSELRWEIDTISHDPLFAPATE